MPRVSVEVGYNRRSWGNFYVTDNRAVEPADFDTVTIAAPQQRQAAGRRRLPGVLLRRQGRQVRPVRQLLHVRERLRGRDVLLARRGLQRQRPPDERLDCSRVARRRAAASGTRAPSRPSCPSSRWRAPPGTGISQVAACAVNEVWQTNLRGLASYTIPKIRRADQRHHSGRRPTRSRRPRRTPWPATACRWTATTTSPPPRCRRPSAGPCPAAPPRRPSTWCCRARSTAPGSTRSTCGSARS